MRRRLAKPRNVAARRLVGFHFGLTGRRERCQAPAVQGWTVCRFHGARGGAPKGKANGAYKHGLYPAEAVKERRLLSDLLRQSQKAIAALPCEGKQ